MSVHETCSLCKDDNEVYSIGVPYCPEHTAEQFGVAYAPSTIADAGLGLFAKKAFKPYESICPYYGVRCKKSDLKDANDAYILQLYDGWYLNADWVRGIGSLANTQWNPKTGKSITAECNAKINSRPAKTVDISFKELLSKFPWLIATKPIAEGEEIFCFYE